MTGDRPEIRVALIEDDRATREGFRLLLAGTPGYSCVGAWGSVEEARVAAARAEAPDVVLLDVRLPGIDGASAVGEFRARWPTALVLMLTSLDDEGTVLEALCNGAVGYILKRTAPARILEAISEATQGGSPMSPEIARRVVGLFQRGAPLRPTVTPITLSPRESQLLGLLAEGHGYQSAADALGIGLNTVRKHIRSLYEKLEVHTRGEAVGKAMRAGLIS